MTHDERVFYHMYTTCETPAEHAERIVKLEELVVEYARAANYLCERWDECEYCELSGDFEQLGGHREKCVIGRLNDKANELGIEVS